MLWCGPKLSLCCSIVSIWGIIQLIILGVFFYIKSYALGEEALVGVGDISNYKTLDDFYKKVDAQYEQIAYNCWIAAVIYVVTLGVSAWQFYLNNQKQLQEK